MQFTPRKTLLLGFASLIGVGAAVAPSSKPTQDEIELVASPVAGNVWMVEGRGGFAGGNLAVLKGPDGALVIDGMLAGLAERYGAMLDEVLRDQEGRVRYMVNTHWHGDHTGNNPLVTSRGAEVIAHAKVRERLAADENLGAGTDDGVPVDAMPSLTFESEVVVHLAGERVRIQHVGPAHTDGDSIVWFEGAKVVHLGDVMFNGMFPFVDLTSGASHRGLLQVVEDVLAEIDDTWKVIPGHGPLCAKAELVVYRDMLKDCIDRVQGQLDQGQSFEHMLSNGLLDDYAEKWRWNFIDEKAFLSGLVLGLSE